MKVVHLTRDLPPRCNGGISTAVAGLVAASARAGVDVAVVSFDGWRPKARESSGQQSAAVQLEDGVQVLRVDSPADLEIAARFVRQANPDVLHVHHGMLWSFARRCRQQARVAAVLSVHVLQQEMNRIRGVSEMTMSLSGQLQALKEADRVIAPSEAVHCALLEQDPGLRPRLERIPLGIDDTARARQAAEAIADRAATSVCYVGRFDFIKGSDLLVQIFAHVLDRVAGSRFEIAGGVPDNGKAERRWVRRWRRDAPASLQQRTSLLGWRSADEVAELYGRSAVLVVPSRYETFGQVVLEGMVHGCAVTASACGGISELVEHDETGLLSTAGDAVALADDVVALLRDPGRARRIATQAATAARARHLWDDAVEGYIASYRDAR